MDLNLRIVRFQYFQKLQSKHRPSQHPKAFLHQQKAEDQGLGSSGGHDCFQDNLSPANTPPRSNTEVETLTNALLQRQEALEASMAERTALALQLERLEVMIGNQNEK